MGKPEETAATLALAKSTAATALDKVIEECSLTELGGLGQMTAAITLASGMRRIRELLTDDVMRDVVELQGNRLGFLTDRDREPPGQRYPVSVVRDCAIECVMRGGRLVGNEMNIIGGNSYMTREFFERAVCAFEGLTDLKEDYSVPTMRGDGAIVEVSATWNLDGKPDSIKRTLAIRVNKGMGADAILGKAKRKLLAAVLRQVTGSPSTVPEGDIDDPPMKHAHVVDVSDVVAPPPAAGATASPGDRAAWYTALHVDERIAHWSHEFTAVSTLGDLTKAGELLAALEAPDSEVRQAVEPSYTARRAQLKAAGGGGK